MNSKNLSHLLILSMVAGLCFGYVIESPRKTNWGVWGNWVMCPTNQFVVGMQLKVEAYQGYYYDDTALNGIKFFCAPLDDLYKVTEITASRSDGYGDWLSKNRCVGSIATGFELRSEEFHGQNYDDTSANNVRLLCSGGKQVEGDGMPWGDWTGPQKCDDGYALCGLRVQIDPYQGQGNIYDDTTLNNVDMECCKIPNPATSCIPTDEWLPIQACDNQLKDRDMTCSYEMKVGLSNDRSSTKGSSSETQVSASYSATLEVTGEILSTSFTASIGISKTTGYNWQQSTTDMWNSEVTQHIEVPVKAGKSIRIDQVKGHCGGYLISASKYRVVQL